MEKKGNIRWLWLSILVIVIDQWTKHLAIYYLTLKPIAVMPFLSLRLAFNKGAAFSLLNSASGWQNDFFIGLAILVGVMILAWLAYMPKQSKLLASALALILGGAFGNLIDRFTQGFVIDFIDVYVKYWHWPTFNIADSAITIGVLLLILDAIS